jgi:hypothetical protein
VESIKAEVVVDVIVVVLNVVVVEVLPKNDKN